MPAEVIAASLLTAGLRSDFKDNYMKSKRASDARLGNVMQIDVPSDKLTELFAYPLSAAHMKQWPRGKDIPNKPFTAVQFSVTNKDWGHRITWHRNDRADDQTGSLYENAQQGGKSGGVMDERIFFQILTGATDANLLESLPNAPDGAALFATTAGGAARFGATNGNLLTGTGVATAQAVRSDFWNTMAQFRLFQDTEGQPLYDDSDLDQGATIIAGAANESVFREAFLQGRTIQIVTNPTVGGGTDNAAAAAVTNTILESGLKITLWLTQRITDNDWFVGLKGAWRKAIFSTSREAMKEEFANMDNSDYSKDTGDEFIQWHQRKGYGVNLPFGLNKVNN